MLDKIIMGSYTNLQKAIFVNKTCGVEIFDVGASNIQPDYYKRDVEIAESREYLTALKRYLINNEIYILTDAFASSDINQAHALSDILDDYKL